MNTVSDIHALSGAYAIDALDDIERAQFERHLAECSECQSEVASLREASALMAEATALPAPESLKAQVLADIALVRPLPPLLEESAAPVPDEVARRRRFRGAALVAAAAVVAALGAGVVVTEPWADETQQQPVLTAADRVLQAPDREEVTREISNGGTATVVRSESHNAAVVVPEGMAPLPTDKVYQLWLMDSEGEMVSAGLMHDTSSPVLLEGEAATARAAAVSIEPAGGSVEPDTDEIVGVFRFQQA